MTLCTANGRPVFMAVITQPVSGAWTAEIAADAETLSGGVEIVAGAATFRGTAYRSGASRSVEIARVVGGAGALAVDVEPRSYRDVDIGLVLRQIAQDVGERVSSSCPRSTLSQRLEAWTRVGGAAARALTVLAGRAGARWRVLDDGSIWLGEERWPDSGVDADDLEVDPQSGRRSLWMESPTLRPGALLGGRRVVKVEHRIGDRVRTSVWTEDDEVPGDDVGAAVEALVRHHTARVDYLAAYPATVVAQNGDGTLELQPDDARLPGFSRVPVRYGVPGVRAKVAAGARVCVAFEAGDPSRAAATVWESASVTELVLPGAQRVTISGAGATVDVAGPGATVNVGGSGSTVNLSGGGAGVARMGDTVQAGPFPGTVTKGSLLVKAGG